MADKQNEIKIFLERFYDGAREDEKQEIIKYLVALWDQFEPIAEDHFVSEFTNGCKSKFQQRFWEMFVYDHLLRQGFDKDSITSADEGPDFKVITADGQTIWIECVAPDKDDALRKHWGLIKKKKWALRKSNLFALRWTTASSAKLKKLTNYIENEIINAETDAVVLAINSANLGLTGGRGDNDHPMIVDITYGKKILKTKNGSDVHTDLFLTDKGEIISALMGSSVTPTGACFFKNKRLDVDVVHNHRAKVKLDPGILGARREFNPE